VSLTVQLSEVIINPLVARDWVFALGDVVLSYHGGATFHAQLPALASGTRAFTVTGMSQGLFNITQLPSGQHSQVPVGADGILRFSAAVGGASAVDAVHV
jgi:hypothetical protein